MIVGPMYRVGEKGYVCAEMATEDEKANGPVEAAKLRTNKNGSDEPVEGFDLRDWKKADIQGLRGADGTLDLVGAILCGVPLEDAQLQGACLHSAQLQGANLRSAQLQGANLRHAQLQGADLITAQLQGASLCKAQLQGALLYEAQLQGADLSKADLSVLSKDFRLPTETTKKDKPTRLGKADLSVLPKGSEYQTCTKEGVKVSDAARPTNLTDAKATGADFSGANLSGATFTAATLKDATLKGAKSASLRPPERPASGALSGAWRAKSLLCSVSRTVVAVADDDDDDDDSDGESEAEEDEKEKSPIEAKVEKSLNNFMDKLATGAKVFMDKADKLLDRVKVRMDTTLAEDGRLAKLLLEKLEEPNVTLAAFNGILSTEVIRPLRAELKKELEEELVKLQKDASAELCIEPAVAADANADPVADSDANAEVPVEVAPGATVSNANNELLRQLLEAYKLQVISATGESALMKRLSPIMKNCVRAASARAAPGRAVDEEQSLVRPEDSVKCLVQQLWPALLASLEAQARRPLSRTYYTYTHMLSLYHARAFCVGERHHPLQRFATDRESGEVGAADGGAPR